MCLATSRGRCSLSGTGCYLGRVASPPVSEGQRRSIRNWGPGVEQLPGYAPDLNPDEGIWQYLKNVELKNVCFENLEALKKQLRLAFERLRHKTSTS